MTKKQLDKHRAWKPPVDVVMQADIRSHWTTMKREQAAEIESALAKYFAQHPGAFALYMLLRTTEEYHKTTTNQHSRAVKAAADPKLRAMVEMVARQWWGSVLQLEQTAKKRYGLFSDWQDGPSGFAELVAEVLGLEFARVPTLEEFMTTELKRRGRAPQKDSDL